MRRWIPASIVVLCLNGHSGMGQTIGETPAKCSAQSGLQTNPGMLTGPCAHPPCPVDSWIARDAVTALDSMPRLMVSIPQCLHVESALLEHSWPAVKSGVLLIFLFFFLYWKFNTVPCACQAITVPLSYAPSLLDHF